MEAGEIFTKWYMQAHKDCGLKVASKNEKHKWLWLFIDHVLDALTFGKNDDFYTGTTTTLGNTVYFPAGWTVNNVRIYDCIILRHEAIHVKQNLKWGFGNLWLGTVLMAVAYLLFPFPIFFAWFRYRLEREAYWESYKAAIELKLQPNIEHYVDLLTGPSYFWAWFSKRHVLNWFKNKLKLDSA